MSGEMNANKSVSWIYLSSLCRAILLQKEEDHRPESVIQCSCLQYIISITATAYGALFLLAVFITSRCYRRPVPFFIFSNEMVEGGGG